MKSQDRPKRQKKRAAKSFAELAEQIKAPRPAPVLPVGPDPADDPALLAAIHGPGWRGES